MTQQNSAQDDNIVVYHLFRKMPPAKRLLIAFFLIAAGFALQFYLVHFLPGLPIAIFGMVLLLVKGYSNKVNFKGYDPSAKWEVVDRSALEQVVELNVKMKRWARSVTSISSGIGAFVFFILLIGFFILAMAAYANGNQPLLIVGVNAALLILPFWFSGNKKVLTTPRLVVKIKGFLYVLDQLKDRLTDHKVDYYLLKIGGEKKIPDDVKIRVMFKDQLENFLGMYVQISVNSVSGSDYPYLYVVFIAKKGFGLKQRFNRVSVPRGVVKEYELKNDVEVIVIRQLTTKTSGYHTRPAAMMMLFALGIDEGMKVAGRH
ncbi:MAG: hypothetical protein R6V49_06170 [Bacteroidales bacterium]